MIALSKRLLKPRIVTCGRCTTSAAGVGVPAASDRSISRASISRSERLHELTDIYLLRDDADLRAEIGKLLQIDALLRRHVLDHGVAEHRHFIDEIVWGERILGEMLARLLRVA